MQRSRLLEVEMQGQLYSITKDETLFTGLYLNIKNRVKMENYEQHSVIKTLELFMYLFKSS